MIPPLSRARMCLADSPVVPWPLPKLMRVRQFSALCELIAPHGVACAGPPGPSGDSVEPVEQGASTVQEGLSSLPVMSLRIQKGDWIVLRVA